MGKVLGKGLEALIKSNDSEENTKYLSGQIPIEKINILYSYVATFGLVVIIIGSILLIH